MNSQYTDLQTEKKNSEMDDKDRYTTLFLKAAEQPFDKDIIKQKRLEWWWNVRSKDNGGLRLTEHAMAYIDNDAQIKSYKVEFPKGFSITPQVLLWLDKFIESPYYITNRSITVLKEKAAFELYLFSGDVKKYGYSKALNKRLNQNSEE